MLNRVIFTGFTETDLTPELWERLAASVGEVVRLPLDDPTYAEELETADGVILRLGMKADQSFQERAPNLRYIGMYGTGYGGIDVEFAKANGVIVTNVADYSTESVAELVVGMTLNMLRNLYDEQRRAGGGDVAETEFQGRDLRSMRFGVIGAGHIGGRVMRLVHEGFGSPVAYWSRTRRPAVEAQLGAEYLELDELCRTVDVLSLHLAWTPETTGLLTAALVDSLTPGALLVNTAPNELLDLGAVLERCNRSALMFGMDHADELSAEEFERLRETKNVFVYPPIGYATREASARKQEVLVENIESFLAGNTQNHVNP